MNKKKKLEKPNQSGIIPLGYKVLIKIIEVEEKTKGGIIIPDTVRDIESAASQLALVLDYGPAAFTVGVGDLPTEWDWKPNVGDKVVINKYAGIIVKGEDGKEYRIISDKEILGKFEKEAK